MEYYNHDPSAEAISYPVYRRTILAINEDAQELLKRLLNRRIVISTIRSELKELGVSVTAGDLYNQRARIQST